MKIASVIPPILPEPQARLAPAAQGAFAAPEPRLAPATSCPRWIAVFLALGTWAFSNPVLQLDFEKAQAGSVNASPGGLSGKLSPKGRGPLWCQGTSGLAAWFTGDKEECIAFDAPALHGISEEFGLRLWVYPVRFGNHQGLVWKGDRGKVPEQCQYKLTIRPEGNVEFGCKGPKGEWAQLISDRPLPLGKWTRVTVSFSRGDSALWFGRERTAQGLLTYPQSGGGTGEIRKLPPCAAPLLIGVMEMPGGTRSYPFCGAVDGLELSDKAVEPDAPASPGADDPLRSLVLFDKTVTLAQAASTPVLSGRISGGDAWLLEVSDAQGAGASLWQPGSLDGKGQFRILVDDFTGPFDLGPAVKALRFRAFKKSASSPLSCDGARAVEGAKHFAVTVSPKSTFQRLRRQAAYANPPKNFTTNAAEQRRLYGPFMDELRTAGIGQLDFAFGSLAAVEPKNEDGDAHRLDLNAFRANWKNQGEIRNLLAFIRYAVSEGFDFGIRSTGFAAWQTPTDPATGAVKYDVDEIAECWTAVLLLLKEEGLNPTHLIPVWEPNYAPETVARICAATSRLSKEQGLSTPIVGPYVLTTGGQSENMAAMPDRYDEGARYTKAYLDACPDAPIIGLEDYASGTALIRPNLERLWREVITPMSAGKSRELWMIEYGAPCGIGPWNFFPSRWHGALSTWESAFRLARAMNQLLDGGVSGFFFWKAWDAIGDAQQLTPSSWGLLKGPLHDGERRLPFYTGRIFWKNLPEGAVRIACSAEAAAPGAAAKPAGAAVPSGELLVNAVREGRSVNVFLVNPRGEAVNAEVVLDRGSLAPQARFLSSTEAEKYREIEIYGQGADRFAVTLAPRSVNALLCRLAASETRFTQTRWPSANAGEAFLTDLSWISCTTRKGGSKPYGDGRDIDFRRDENIAGDWLVHKGVRYRRGLSSVGKAEITFAIPDGVSRFTSRFGVDDASEGGGPASFAVKVDGKRVHEGGPVMKGDAPAEVSMPISGRTLTLAVDAGEKVNTAWLEAAFAK